MIASLTGHTVFACHCKVAGDFIVAGLLVLDAGFVAGRHELWDAQNNRYWVEVDGAPSSLSYRVELRRVDAAV